MATSAIIGSSGLIGSFLLNQMLEDAYYEKIKILVRRNPEISHPKIDVQLVNFEVQEELEAAIAGCESVFCSVGTTTKKVKGDKAAYRKVDFDIPVAVARACEKTNAPRFLLVSSVGASSKSKNFYLKLKGEVEDAVQKMTIPAVSIYRPSMLIGKKTEFRPAERIFQPISQFFAFLTPGIYRPVKAAVVAARMIEDSKSDSAGFRVLHFGGKE